MADTTVDKVCPECGVSLKALDIYAHSLVHYPDYLDPAKSSKEAKKRKELLLNGGVTVKEYNTLKGGE